MVIFFNFLYNLKSARQYKFNDEVSKISLIDKNVYAGVTIPYVTKI